MAKVLIIDDDEMICDLLAVTMEKQGHEVRCALTLQDGVGAALSEAFDVVFLDVQLPDGSGLHALPEIRDAPSSPEVIVITGAGDVQGAELAIKSGAWDYIEKGLSLDAIMLHLVRALQYRSEKLARSPTVALKRVGIVGNAPNLKECLDLVAQAASSDANVLIQGQTGTGKELFAAAIHDNSRRAGKNFVVVDCTALPETLVESMLFGHERGAFTGADRSQTGLFKQADGGTLFLDEVGELPLALQKSFLRVLQERKFRPIGAREEIKSDFRLVAATNRDLDEMIKARTFREDLLFRLRSFTLSLPALRERSEDIRETAIYHVARLCEQYEMETKGFSPDFFEALRAHGWPGNVRELVQALERAVASARYEPTLFPRHLPTSIRLSATQAAISKDSALKKPSDAPPGGNGKSLAVDGGGDTPLLKEHLERVERQYLENLMRQVNGNVAEACSISGLSRTRLYVRLKKFALGASQKAS